MHLAEIFARVPVACCLQGGGSIHFKNGNGLPRHLKQAVEGILIIAGKGNDFSAHGFSVSQLARDTSGRC